MNIFQITQELQDIFSELEENGGELTPELEQELNVTQEDFKVKVKSYAEGIKLLNSDITLIDSEIKRLNALKKSKEKAIERLNKVIAWAVEMFGDKNKNGNSFVDYGDGKISVVKSKSVTVDTTKVNLAVNNLFNYFYKTKYNSYINKDEIFAEICKTDDATDGTLDLTKTDLAFMKAGVSFDINISQLLDEKGIEFMLKFTDFISNFKVKGDVSKTEIKPFLEVGQDLHNIAEITVKNNVRIK